MSVQVQLAGVEETLLIPLWARAAETRRPDGLVHDPRAVEMVDRLAYDFSQIARDTATQTGIAVRTALLDEAVTAFLTRHPGAVVLNLAAGLDTRFFRVGAAASCWYEVDLPGPMRLRRELIPEGDDHRFVAGSVLEPGWLEAVAVPVGTPVLVVIEGLLMYLSREQIAALLGTLAARFPGCEALVELVGRFTAGNTWWVRSVSSTSATFQGGVDAPTELEALVPGLRVLETWYTLDHHWPRWGWMALGALVPVLRHQHKLARLVLGS